MRMNNICSALNTGENKREGIRTCLPYNSDINHIFSLLIFISLYGMLIYVCTYDEHAVADL